MNKGQKTQSFFRSWGKNIFKMFFFFLILYLLYALKVVVDSGASSLQQQEFMDLSKEYWSFAIPAAIVLAPIMVFLDYLRKITRLNRIAFKVQCRLRHAGPQITSTWRLPKTDEAGQPIVRKDGSVLYTNGGSVVPYN